MSRAKPASEPRGGPGWGWGMARPAPRDRPGPQGSAGSALSLGDKGTGRGMHGGQDKRYGWHLRASMPAPRGYLALPSQSEMPNCGAGWRMMLSHATPHPEALGDILGGDGGVPDGRWQRRCAAQHLFFGSGADSAQPWHCGVTDVQYSCSSWSPVGTAGSPASILSVPPPFRGRGGGGARCFTLWETS